MIYAFRFPLSPPSVRKGPSAPLIRSRVYPIIALYCCCRLRTQCTLGRDRFSLVFTLRRRVTTTVSRRDEIDSEVQQQRIADLSVGFTPAMDVDPDLLTSYQGAPMPIANAI